jgi:PEP-CTERM motif
MKSIKAAFLGGFALSLLAPLSAYAAAFFIDDTRADDNILFSANDFEGGIFIGNTLLQQGLNNPGSLLFPEAAAPNAPIQYPFHGQWINPTGTVPPAVQVAFLEPGTTIISDILYCEYQPGSLSSINGFFISDTDSPGGLSPSLFVPGVPVTNWDETLGAFTFSAPFLQASANSDVPEPATLALFGIAALAISRRPSRRSA